MKRLLKAVGALHVVALSSSSLQSSGFALAMAASSASPAASAARPSGDGIANPAGGTSSRSTIIDSISGAESSPSEGNLRDGPYIPKAAFPGPDRWTTVEEGVEFLPAEGFVGHDISGLPPSLHRHLRSQLSNPYSVQPFVNGESDYDEYQQAWRYLGFVIDCDSNYDDDSSWDGGTGEGCQRYLIWAAVS